MTSTGCRATTSSSPPASTGSDARRIGTSAEGSALQRSIHAIPEPSSSSLVEHRTAGVLIIGNEILSGKVTDENSPFLARELRSLGVSLRRIEVLPDEVEIIAEATERMSRDYDFVFTSGGVGPTHDDKTVEAVAKGLGQDVVRNPLLVDVLKMFYGKELNEARLRMADVPAEAEVIYGGEVRIPVVRAKNVTILPGVPDLFRKEFLSIRERFAAAPYFCRRAYVTMMEGDIVDVLDDVERSFREVEVGSYPVFDPEIPYKVMLTFDSKSAHAAQSALEKFVGGIPPESVYKIE